MLHGSVSSDQVNGLWVALAVEETEHQPRVLLAGLP